MKHNIQDTVTVFDCLNDEEKIIFSTIYLASCQLENELSIDDDSIQTLIAYLYKANEFPKKH